MEIANSPELQPSMQNALSNLAEAYSHHLVGENIDPRQIAEDLTKLYQDLGSLHRNNKNLVVIFQKCGPLATNPDTGKNLIDDPNILKIIYKKPKSKHPVRKILFKAALGVGVLAVGTSAILAKEIADLRASGGPPPISYDKNKLFSSDAQVVPIEQTAAPATKIPTETPTRATATPESVDTFMEFLSPLIQAAQNKRTERLKNDPEYAQRVDPELNSNRPLNIVIFGYGQTFEPPAAEKVIIGSPTIISYNAKTKAFDQISLTHDIRAPEIERYLQSKGQKPDPVRIDQAYRIGGFDLMRRTLESATGLSVDFQMSFQDSMFKDMVDQVFQGLPLNIPFDIDTQPFYQDDQKYGAGHFVAGQKILSGIEVMQFMKALPQNYDRKFERNERKHLVTKALLENLSSNKNKPGFILNTLTFLAKEGLFNRRFESDFDLGLLINVATKISGKTGSSNAFSPKFDRSIYIVDTASGDGGVQWVTSSIEINPASKHDLDSGEYIDKAFEIPGDGNPHATNLITGYWKSLRDFVRQKLTKTTP